MLETIQSIDISILNFIQDHLRTALGDVIMPFITFLGNKGLCWIVLAVFLTSFPKYRKIGITLGIALILGLVFGNLILKNAVGRMRPFQFYPFDNLLITQPHDKSFPSGHTLSSVASAIVLLYYKKSWGIPALIVAALIAFSRLYLFVHYPSDILGGIVLGIICAFMAIYIWKLKSLQQLDQKLSPSRSQL